MRRVSCAAFLDLQCRLPCSQTLSGQETMLRSFGHMRMQLETGIDESAANFRLTKDSGACNWSDVPARLLEGVAIARPLYPAANRPSLSASAGDFSDRRVS